LGAQNALEADADEVEYSCRHMVDQVPVLKHKFSAVLLPFFRVDKEVTAPINLP
jgi:hypothetical protein